MNSPEKNRSKFTGNPHKPGEKIFRTGQLGRWNDLGELEFLGIIEEELEIKGMKVDAEEGKKEVLAFYKGLAQEDAILEEMKSRFPRQFRPDWIIRMNSLPVSSNRKLRY